MFKTDVGGGDLGAEMSPFIVFKAGEGLKSSSQEQVLGSSYHTPPFL